MNNKISVFSLVITCFVITGCMQHGDRFFLDPLNLQVDQSAREPKQATVTPSEVSFAVRFPKGKTQLSDPERRAAVGFLNRRATEASDEVFVDFGVLHETTEMASDRRITISEVIVAAGLDPANVRVRANVRGVAENEINLTVRTYLVTLPGCPDYTSRAGRTFDNRPHSNWGCATATNLGLMVAEPSDLLRGRSGTLGDAEALTLSTQRLRAGQTKPLVIDETNTADTFGVQGTSGGGNQ